jgi:hypothetical protein
VFDNRALRKIFVPERDEATGEWRKLRNEELYVLFCSHNIVGVSKQEERDRRHICHAGGGGRRVTGGSRKQTTCKTEV